MQNKPKSKSSLSIILTLILALLLINIIRSILNYKHGLERLDNAQKELNKLIQENHELKETKSYVQSDEYLEKSALENLNLTSPENTILYIETDTHNENEQDQQIYETTDIPTEKDIVKLWIKALNL